jgi:hypothetical protein
MAHVPSDLALGRCRHDGPIGENLGVSVLRAGGLKGQRLTLTTLSQLPLCAMVCSPLLISTDPNGKLCTPASSKKASLVLLIV